MSFELESYEPVELVLDRRVWLGGVGEAGDDASERTAMSKSDPHFEQLVLSALSDRLIGEVNEADVPSGDNLVGYRATLAIDALAEHRGISVSDNDLTDCIPALTLDEKLAIRREFESRGLSDELKRNIRREKTLSWLIENSKIEYN